MIMMTALDDAVCRYIRKERLLQPGDRVGVAVSGGADSVALLLVMLGLRKQLGLVISAVHFNHQLRGPEADADEKFVEQLSRQHDLEFLSARGSVTDHAQENHLSVEAAGRSMRYDFFFRLLSTAALDHVATAHTLDDQAETVLLRLVRGAGTRGLAGIYSARTLNQGLDEPRRYLSRKSIIRPFLEICRKDIETYLINAGQAWREDSSNRDSRYSRNFVRHEILPQLEHRLNPAVREVLADSASIAHAEEEYWTDKIAGLLPQMWKIRNDGSTISAQMDLPILLSHPLAVQRRLIRAATASLGLQLELKHVDQILHIGASVSYAGKSTVLPGGWLATRRRGVLHFQRGDALAGVDYEYVLSVPGRVVVAEVNRTVEAVLIKPGDESIFDSDDTFDVDLLGTELRVRNWRAGDRFWPAHAKTPKKVKELLQERKLTGISRKLCPVVVRGADVIWLGGFPAPRAFRPINYDQPVIVLRETGL